ncbi:hypothetical protein [Geminocystis sp. GBBB08]|uniref:hypothetical protein n=1 Tax=Geminocystis sp. GBBB08 TaxID=2604140 RepID=UPI0027E314EB|nr:hypothetical protein [Geminocystis sp. GBBB08]MBL1208374.1 hypothetical protein [Geminocystis sp. GBBB08]
MKKIRAIEYYLLGILTLIIPGYHGALAQSTITTTGSFSPNQATATGSVVIFTPTTSSTVGYTQTISGSITLPFASFNGPLLITPSITGFVAPPLVDSLTINPGGINFFAPPITLEAQTAQILSGLSPSSDLSDIVSIIRANSNLLQGSSNAPQASATGATVLQMPDGSLQTVSGEIYLPNGLYYEGASSPLDAGCGFGSGCLVISPTVEAIPEDLTGEAYRITQLIIDPGFANIALFPFTYNLNAAAAQVLSGVDITTQLSDAVSIIRAGRSANGPYSTAIQARATGTAMIENPDGSTQTISGEISLPAGLYYDDPQGNNPNCAGSACLTILPKIKWNDLTGTGAQANSTFIESLTINPGFVQPGDPSSPTAFGLPSSFDFNAAVANILYRYLDEPGDQLANIVSVIRAGAGSGSLSPNRPSARASGTVMIKNPNGASQSASGEISLPGVLYYEGSLLAGCTGGEACFVITPSIQNIPNLNSDDPNLRFVQSLLVDPGSSNDPNTVRGWDFEAATADALLKATTLQEQVSIIRAGAGSGLE